MIKFLPSYVGSKAHWVDKLQKYKGRKFVELFCGSAVLSANLASEAILNDIDPYISAILSRFDELEVPDVFTKENYFLVRGLPTWWKYSFCLQKMSFSGVFRYSKNGYNVPCKPTDSIQVRPEYETALVRWRELTPAVLNEQYYEVPVPSDSVLVLDPPYEDAVASYNGKFDYEFYWQFVRLNENCCETIILFDFESNLPFITGHKRKTRVNGAKKGNTESMFIFENSLKEGQKGEELFYSLFGEKLTYVNKAFQPDFQLRDGTFLELKSDYYDPRRTPNFFFERYSDKEKKTAGGPWQALEKGAATFAYFFPKDATLYVFDTSALVKYLETKESKLKLVDIPNKTWVTSGYKVNRDSVKHLYKETLN